MADPTVPWGIPLFDDNTPFAPIQAPFNSQSAALNDALTTINDKILDAHEPWQTPTLAGGITVAPGRLAPKYRKIPGGVEIQGSINGSSGSDYLLFTLPSGYAPTGEVRLWASQGGSIQVLASGQVNSPLSGSKASVDFNGFYPL